MIIHPALVQSSVSLIQPTLSDPEDTAISFVAACFTSVIAARARDTRVMYSVTIASFGAEFVGPLMCLTFNSSHCVVKRFPSRCFLIRSAELTLPRIFSILSSWFLSSVAARSTRFLYVWWRRSDCGEPALVLLQRLSRFVRELRVPALVSYWPTQWPYSHSAPCCRTRTQHYSATRLSASMTRLPRCVARRARILQMSSVSFGCTQLRLHLRVHHLSWCSFRPAYTLW